MAPIYEGWVQNSDGSFDLIFGYFNLNTQEIADIPIGPANNIEPGGPDRGQPTHFFTRRSLFVFRVRVPKDFGNRELIWTLSHNGKTEKAYGTLKPDYIIDERIMMMNNGGFGGRGQRLGEPDNNAPKVTMVGERQRTVKAGQPLELTAYASDDGYPRGGIGGANDLGLGVGWFLYRGAGEVRFEPKQESPEFRGRRSRFRARDESGRRTDENGRTEAEVRALEAGGAAAASSGSARPTPAAPRRSGRPVAPVPPAPVTNKEIAAKVTFSDPGTYVIRAMAHDGGLADTLDVTVTVVP